MDQMQSSGPFLCRNISNFSTIYEKGGFSPTPKRDFVILVFLQRANTGIALHMECANVRTAQRCSKTPLRTWTVLSSQHQVQARQKGARKTDRSDGKAAREKGKKFRAPLPSSFQFPLTREPFYSRINMLYFSMLNAFTLVRLATVILC